MSPPDAPPDKPVDKGRLQKYRDTLLEKLILGVPVGLITVACGKLQDRLTGSPWTVVGLAVPLGLAAWLTWRLLKRPNRGRSLLIGLAFLTAYGAVFALISVSDLLVWRQVQNDSTRVQLRPWMLPVRAGDWRYAIAPREAPPADDMIIVLLDPSPGGNVRARNRAREADLIRLATIKQARGVGLDIYFEEKTDADANLCAAVDQARAANVPVWAGYTNKNLGTEGLPAKIGSGELPCFPAANLGSLLGFADSDGRVRAVWLSWSRMQDQPSFSVRGARILEASYGRQLAEKDPDEHVLRYLPPPQDIPVFSEADVYDDPGLLENRLVLIGLNVPEDRFYTPFGAQPGTRIQANAIHSLRVDARITRPDGIWTALVVAVLCYVIVLLAIGGLSTTRLVLVVAGLSLAVVLVAALLMYAWRMWFEVIYALVAMWLLVPLVPVLRLLPAWRRVAGVDLPPHRSTILQATSDREESP